MRTGNVFTGIMGLCVLALLVMGGTSAMATGVIYVDCYTNQIHPGNYQSSEARWWNASNMDTGDDLTDMVDENNVATTVDLRIITPFGARIDGGVVSSTLVDWGNPVTSGSSYDTTGYTDPQIRFEGLTAGGLYNLAFYGARNSGPPEETAGRQMNVTINGKTQSYQSLYGGATTFTNVVADGSGYITVDFSAPVDFGHLGGMSIIPVPSAVLATEVYVDLDATTTHPSGLQSAYNRHWNATDLGTVTNITGIVDENNDATTVTLSIKDAFWAHLAGGPVNSGLVDWGSQVTTESWALITASNADGKIRVKGLTPMASFNLTFYGARNSDVEETPGRQMDVTIGGVMQSYQSLYGGATTFTNVAADIRGYIDIHFNAPVDYAHLSGMSVSPAVYDELESSIYVDFDGDTTHPGNYQSAKSRYWNTSDIGTATNYTDLVDENNNATTIDINVIDSTPARIDGGQASSGLVDWGSEVTAESRYLSDSSGAESAAIRIQGFGTAEVYSYNLTFYGARSDGNPEGTAGRQMDVTINGTTQSYQSQYGGATTFTNVTPDINGHIDVEFDRQGAATFAHLSGMSINAIAPSRGTAIVIR